MTYAIKSTAAAQTNAVPYNVRRDGFPAVYSDILGVRYTDKHGHKTDTRLVKICKGADGGIVDPMQINAKILSGLDSDTEGFSLAHDLLTGKDDYGMNYITASREGKF